MSAETRVRPRRQPAQERSRLTVEAILQAAAQVFERHGYAAGTTNRIADRAGISVGSLYQYFPNKDAVLVALVEQHSQAGIRRVSPLLQSLVEDPPPIEGGLRELLDAMVDLHAQAPRLHRVLSEECPRPAALRAQFESIYHGAVAAIEIWIGARPEVTVRDRRTAAELVVQVIESITHRLVIHSRTDENTARYTNETVALLTRYLTG